MPAPQIQGTPTTVQNQTAGTSFTINKPSGAAVDEYLFAFVRFNTQTATFSDLQGFTEVTHANASGANRQYILYKKVDGTEGASFTFTTSSSAYMAAMVRVSGVHLTTPIDDFNGLAQPAAGTTIDVPSLTTTGPVRLLFWAAGTIAITTTDWTPDNLDTNELVDFQQGTSSTFAVTREEQAAAGASGTRTATWGTSSTGQNGVCCAVIPSDDRVPETLVPTTGGAVTNLSAYDATKIDEDTGSDDAQWLTGTNPSGTSGSSNTNYADAQTTASGIATQLTNPANAVGSSEATTSVTTGATQNTDYANFFTYDETALASAIPSNATITAFGVRLRDALSTLARGTTGIRVDTTNGTQLAAEDAANTGLGTALPATGTGRLISPATLPTRAQIIAASFGVRVRYRRTASQAASYTLDWSRLEISYTTPGSTVNTEVRAPMTDPVATLATGADTGTIRALVRKLGSGSNPSVRLEVRNAAGTLLATALADTAVSSTTGVVVSGTFDQANISNKTDVVVWVVGTGAAGGLVEVGAVNWVALTTAGPSVTQLAGTATSEPRPSATATSALAFAGAGRTTPRPETRTTPKLAFASTGRATPRPASTGLPLTVAPIAGTGRTTPRPAARAAGALGLAATARATPRPAARVAAPLTLVATARATPRPAARVAGAFAFVATARAAPRPSATTTPRLAFAGTLRSTPRPTLVASAKLTFASSGRATPRPAPTTSARLSFAATGRATSRPAPTTSPRLTFAATAQAVSKPSVRVVGAVVFNGAGNASPRPSTTLTGRLGFVGVAVAVIRPVAVASGAIAFAGRGRATPRVALRAAPTILGALAGTGATRPRPFARVTGTLAVAGTARAAPRPYHTGAATLGLRGAARSTPRPTTWALGSTAITLAGAGSSRPRIVSRASATLKLAGAVSSAPRVLSRVSATLKLAGAASSTQRPALRSLSRLSYVATGASRPRPHVTASGIGGLPGTARSVGRVFSTAIGEQFVAPPQGWPVATVSQEVVPTITVGQAY